LLFLLFVLWLGLNINPFIMSILCLYRYIGVNKKFIFFRQSLYMLDNMSGSARLVSYLRHRETCFKFHCKIM